MRATGWRYIPGGPRGSKQTPDGYRAWPCVQGFVVDSPGGIEIGIVRTWSEVEAIVQEHREGKTK